MNKKKGKTTQVKQVFCLGPSLRMEILFKTFYKLLHFPPRHGGKGTFMHNILKPPCPTFHLPSHGAIPAPDEPNIMIIPRTAK